MATQEDIAQIRLLVADLDTENPVFTDPQYEMLMDLEGNVVKRAAARALEISAIDIAHKVGPLRALLDVQLGGRDSAAILTAAAKGYRAEAEAEPGGTPGGGFVAVQLSNFPAVEETA